VPAPGAVFAAQGDAAADAAAAAIAAAGGSKWLPGCPEQAAEHTFQQQHAVQRLSADLQAAVTAGDLLVLPSFVGADGRPAVVPQLCQMLSFGSDRSCNLSCQGTTDKCLPEVDLARESSNETALWPGLHTALQAAGEQCAPVLTALQHAADAAAAAAVIREREEAPAAATAPLSAAESAALLATAASLTATAAAAAAVIRERVEAPAAATAPLSAAESAALLATAAAAAAVIRERVEAPAAATAPLSAAESAALLATAASLTAAAAAGVVDAVEGRLPDDVPVVAQHIERRGAQFMSSAAAEGTTLLMVGSGAATPSIKRAQTCFIVSIDRGSSSKAAAARLLADRQSQHRAAAAFCSAAATAWCLTVLRAACQT